MYFPGARVLVALPMIALPTVGVADLGSVALVHLSVPDDADEAGRAAVQALQFSRTATPKDAEIGFNAAKSVTDLHHQHLDPQSFTIYRDGSVRLTVSKTAPTILFKRLPGLKGLTHTTTTTTVARPHY